jgi:NAD(P)H-hydrate epimerase
MSPPALTREQSRQVDRIAMDEYGFSGLVLMENAGRGIAEALIDQLSTDPQPPRPVLIACGKGNNAGDGFVIARHLAIRGYACRVALWSEPKELRGDAAANFAIIEKMRLPIEMFADRHDSQGLARALDESGWVVDALLGTGVKGSPRPPLDAVIDQLNAADHPILAVDLPSGLDCDTGRPSEHTIRARVTCTMVTPKVGFTAESAADHIGQVQVISIGTPSEIVERIAGPDTLPDQPGAG